MQIFHHFFQTILDKLYEADEWFNHHFTELLSSLFSLFSFKVVDKLDVGGSFISRNSSDIEKECIHTFFAILILFFGWIGGWILKKVFAKLDKYLDDKFKLK